MSWQDNYTIEKLEEDIYAISEVGHVLVRMYVILGEKDAVLIDTGFGKDDLPAAIASITDKPLTVVHTHADWDHVLGDKFFDTVWFHAEDAVYPDARAEKPAHVTVKELREGDVIVCGRRKLEVLYTPGHTMGSLSFFDRENGALFCGDSLCEGIIFLKGDWRNAEAYRDTVHNKYLPLKDQVKVVYPAHDTCPLDNEIISECAQAIDLLLAGKLEGKEGMIPGRDVTCYQYKRPVFAY